MNLNSIKKISIALRLMVKAYGAYRYHIVGLSLLGITGSVLEGIGVNAFIPLLSFASDSSELSQQNFILTFVRSFFGFVHVAFSLKSLLIFICILFSAKAALSIISHYVSATIISTYEEKTRAGLLGGTLSATWPYLLKQKLGYLETILMFDIKKSAALLEQIAAAVSNTANLLVYLVVAFHLSFTITMITLVLGAILTVFVKPLIDRTRIISKRITTTNKEVAHLVNESILGAKTIKSMVASSAVIDAGRIHFQRLKKLQVKNQILRSLITATSQPIGVIFISIIFAMSYRMPHFSIALLVATVYLVQRIFLYVQLFQNSLQGMYENIPYLQAVINYQETVSRNTETNTGDRRFSFGENLVFENVSFSYGNEHMPVLNGVSFTVGKGDMVGIAGSSGAGKTTLVDLMLRLLHPTAGSILIDGGDITTIDIRDWRTNVGYVSQDVFIKNDTFRGNIAFYDQTMTEEEMIEAVGVANLTNVIEQATDGAETQLGERGLYISGGQRQRVALARVVARKPQVLILDEATSSLDPESEAMIQTAIQRLKGKVTIIVIAHRFQTLRICDKLFVLEGGKIIEHGTPTELLQDTSSRFYQMHAAKTAVV